MLTAGVISLLCKFLKQPVVLGYIVAGLLVGPYVCGKAWINDIESADKWAEVGVIFLLFSLGLEFSFKKLLQFGSTAILGCLTIVIGMMTTGFLVGRLLGFNEMNALFLGGMLSMSSTTIVFKALDDLGLRQQKFAGICFGILVVEDLFAVVLMVLLASIAVKNSFEGMEMAWQVIKLIAYLILWFVAGIMLIPTLLKVCRRHLNDETMTIVALGLCLGMVLLAIGAGFSSALGAFVMGSILAETVEAERIEHLVAPIKNMFGAVFFVSVGMMINPQLLLDYWVPISVITVVVIVGQILFASLGVLLSGESLKVAMQAGFSLVQVGEFAFIIAQFGESIGVTEKYLYPVIVAVSVITTFLTPYVIRQAVPAYNWVEKRLPRRARLILIRYARGRNTISEDGALKLLLRKVGVNVSIYLTLCLFIIGIYFGYFSKPLVAFVNQFFPESLYWIGNMVSLTLTIALISPFILKIATKHNNAPEVARLWHGGAVNRASVLAIFLIRLVICFVLIVFCIYHFFAFTYGVVAALALIITFLIFVSKRVRNSSSLIEESFMSNLNAREIAKDNKRAVRRDFEELLLTHDLHIADFQLPSSSSYCGKELKDLGLRQSTSVNIVRIIREGLDINVPGGNERLFPHDIIVVAGSDRQIDEFKKWMDKGEVIKDPNQCTTRRIPFTLQQFVVTANMPFCGKSIANSRIREVAQCAVLGIEHEGRTYMNPDSDILLLEGDTVILAGEEPRIKALVSKIM